MLTLKCWKDYMFFQTVLIGRSTKGGLFVCLLVFERQVDYSDSLVPSPSIDKGPKLWAGHSISIFSENDKKPITSATLLLPRGYTLAGAQSQSQRSPRSHHVIETPSPAPAGAQKHLGKTFFVCLFFLFLIKSSKSYNVISTQTYSTTPG